MRDDLLGLKLEEALCVLHGEGVEAQVVRTFAPKRRDGSGVLRVVYASDDGRRLTVSGFLDPIADAQAAE